MLTFEEATVLLMLKEQKTCLVGHLRRFLWIFELYIAVFKMILCLTLRLAFRNGRVETKIIVLLNLLYLFVSFERSCGILWSLYDYLIKLNGIFNFQVFDRLNQFHFIHQINSPYYWYSNKHYLFEVILNICYIKVNLFKFKKLDVFSKYWNFQIIPRLILIRSFIVLLHVFHWEVDLVWYYSVYTTITRRNWFIDFKIDYCEIFRLVSIFFFLRLWFRLYVVLLFLLRNFCIMRPYSTKNTTKEIRKY